MQGHGQKQLSNELPHISARFNQFILDYTQDLIAIHHLADLSYEYVNPATLRVLGYDKEELLLKSAIELIHPDDKERFLVSLKESLHKSVCHEEFRYRKKDGSYIWLDVLAEIMPQEDDYTSFITISRDVNEWKQDKEALQKTGDLFYTLLEQAPIAIGINREGRTLFVNGAYLDMFGYESNAELFGTPVINQVAPSCRDEIADKIAYRACSEALPHWQETQGRRQNGSIFPLLVQVYNILLPNGDANVTFFSDLSVQKNAEAAIKNQVAAQTLLLEISDIFHKLKTEDIDEMINKTLKMIGEFDKNDRSYVFLLSEDGTAISNTHEWCAEGVQAAIDNIQDVPVNLFPWGMEKLHTMKHIYIPRSDDLPPEANLEKDIMKAQSIQSILIVPMILENQLIGFIGFDSVRSERIWSKESIMILEGVAYIIANAIHRKKYHLSLNRAILELEMSLDKMQQILMQAVTSLGTVLDIRDPYTAGHQKKVAKLAQAIAEEMGLSTDQIKGIAVAGNLHDTGTINVPIEILSKPRGLSDIEFELIKTHSQAGFEIIKEINFPWPVAEIVLQHHERMNGTGYPHKLDGEEILLEARIVAVADVVEAMASHRPYRPALGIDTALEEIARNSGILYDANVVEVCLTLFREGRFGFEC